jgi:hypothetical protein
MHCNVITPARLPEGQQLPDAQKKLGVDPEQLKLVYERLGVDPEQLKLIPEQLKLIYERLGVDPEQLQLIRERPGLDPDRARAFEQLEAARQPPATAITATMAAVEAGDVASFPEQPQPRQKRRGSYHKPERDRIDLELKTLFPPDGKPPPTVTNAKIVRDVRNGYPALTYTDKQILRRAGRAP